MHLANPLGGAAAVALLLAVFSGAASLFGSQFHAPPATPLLTAAAAAAAPTMRRPSVRALLWACLCLCTVPLGQSTPDALSSRRCFTEAELTALRVAPTARPAALPPLRLERNMWQGHYLSTAAAAILLKEANGFATLIEDTDGQTTATARRGRVAALRCSAPPTPRHAAWFTVHCRRQSTRRLDTDSCTREPFRCRGVGTARAHALPGQLAPKNFPTLRSCAAVVATRVRWDRR